MWKRAQCGLEAALADITSRADNIRPDFNLHVYLFLPGISYFPNTIINEVLRKAVRFVKRAGLRSVTGTFGERLSS